MERTTTMTRIPLDPPPTLRYRAVEWFSRRMYGAVLDPAAAMGHHPRLLVGNLRYERSIQGWHRLDPTLKALAVLCSAVTIGCSWCVDFGHWISTQEGVD